jgi:acyl-CoA thioester hydrolase
MGIIHHGAYAVYLEEARAAFLEAAGYPYGGVRRQGFDFAVLELYVRYRRPVRFGDDVDVGLAVDLGRTTFQIDYLLEVDGELRATAASVHAAVDPEGRPSRLPSWIREAAAFGRGS